MRLEQYLINEKSMPISAIRDTDEYKKLYPPSQKEFETIWKKIKKDCQPFLKQLIKGNKNLLYRNMDVNSNIGSLKVRMDREPRDTPKVIHKIFDDILEDMFGYRARSKTIFCSGAWNWEEGYGSSYIIFPKGPFKYLWSKNIRDSYGFVSINSIGITLQHVFKEEMIALIGGIDYTNWLYELSRKIKNNNLTVDEYKLVYMALEYNVINKLDYVEDNLVNAIKSENEIMIFCKDYYYLKTYEFAPLIKLLLWGSIK